MRTLDNTEKAQVLRYAELALKSTRSTLEAHETQEMAEILQKLELNHEEILALAERNLTNPEEC
jgi:hypothetical protein